MHILLETTVKGLLSDQTNNEQFANTVAKLKNHNGHTGDPQGNLAHMRAAVFEEHIKQKDDIVNKFGEQPIQVFTSNDDEANELKGLKANAKNIFATTKDTSTASSKFINWSAKGTGKENNPKAMVFHTNFANPTIRGGHGLEVHSHAQEEGELMQSSTAALLAQKAKTAAEKAEQSGVANDFNLAVSTTDTGKSNKGAAWKTTGVQPLVVLGQVSNIATTRKMPTGTNGWRNVDPTKPSTYFNEKEPEVFNELAMAADRIGDGNWGADSRESANIIFETAGRGFLLAKQVAAKNGADECFIEVGLLGAGAFKNSPEITIAMQYMAARLAGVEIDFTGISKERLARVDEIKVQINEAIAAGKSPDEIIAAMPQFVLTTEGRKQQDLNFGWACDKDGNPKLGKLVDVINKLPPLPDLPPLLSRAAPKSSAAVENQAAPTNNSVAAVVESKTANKSTISIAKSLMGGLQSLAQQMRFAPPAPDQALDSDPVADIAKQAVSRVGGTKELLTPKFLQDHKGDVVLFGDNNIDKNRKSGERQGFGGQAGMFLNQKNEDNGLDRANGIGITTTFFNNDGSPSTHPNGAEMVVFKQLMKEQFEPLIEYAKKGGAIVFPEGENGKHAFGTGLAVKHLANAYIVEKYREKYENNPKSKLSSEKILEAATPEMQKEAMDFARPIAEERQKIIAGKLLELKAASQEFAGPELNGAEKAALQKELLVNIAKQRGEAQTAVAKPATKQQPSLVSQDVGQSAASTPKPQPLISAPVITELNYAKNKLAALGDVSTRPVVTKPAVTKASAYLSKSVLDEFNNVAPSSDTHATRIETLNGQVSHAAKAFNARKGSEQEGLQR